MTVIIISLWLFLFGAMVSGSKEDKKCCVKLINTNTLCGNNEEFSNIDEAIKRCGVKK